MTAHQIVKISLDQLRPGMYVGNVFNERAVLLYSANTLIVDFAQIEALRRQGVVAVGINLQKGSGRDVAPLRDAEQQQEHSIFPAENPSLEVFDRRKMQQAIEIRTATIGAVQGIIASARTGRLFSIGSISNCVESILDSMLDEPDMLLHLCRIRSVNVSTYEHSVNVAVLMVGFSAAMGFARERILDAGIGGMLHDIGMVRLPEDLMEHQATCTRQEYELLKSHPALGVDIVNKGPQRIHVAVRNVIGQHHERCNGSGYPAGLRGKQIDELALVCAIADMYDSLTTPRAHTRDYLPQEALALIFQGADDDFPRSMVEHFTKLLGIYPVGSFVKLDSGEMGVVVKNNRQKLLTPVVRVLFNETGSRLKTPYLKDLSLTENNQAVFGVRVAASLDPHSFNVTTDDIVRVV